MTITYTCPKCSVRHHLEHPGYPWGIDSPGGWYCDSCMNHTQSDQWTITTNSDEPEKKTRYTCNNKFCSEEKNIVTRSEVQNTRCARCGRAMFLFDNETKESEKVMSELRRPVPEADMTEYKPIQVNGIQGWSMCQCIGASLISIICNGCHHNTEEEAMGCMVAYDKIKELRKAEHSNKMLEQIKEFWMVWRPDGNSPAKQHETSLTAIDEAERLSLNFPDKDFHVLRCIGKFRSEVDTTWSDAT